MPCALCHSAGGLSARCTLARLPNARGAGAFTFDITLGDASNELVVRDTLDVEFLAPGVSGIDLDLCNFVREVRSPQRPNGFRDPCAEPSVPERRWTKT